MPVMKRTFIVALFRLLGVASVILSIKPRLDLFLYYERSPEHFAGYAHAYWNYWIIRSWLIALAGLVIGLVLFWLADCIKAQETAAHGRPYFQRPSIGKIAALVCLVSGIILGSAFLPGLSNFFGKNAFDNQVPMEVSPAPATGMAFMVMSNELAAPHVEFSPMTNDSAHPAP